MAGVAPQQRGGGSSATTIGMVVSIIVAVALLGALIFLFTQQEQLRANAEQAGTARERMASRSDETAAKQMYPDAGGANKTLVGEMVKGTQLLCGSITGNRNDPPQTAVKSVQTALEEIVTEGNVPDPDQMSISYGVVSIIKDLYQLYADQRSRNEQAQKALDKANADLEAALARNEALHQGFNERLGELAAQVEQLQSAKGEFESLKNEEIQALAGEVEAKQGLLDSLRRDQSKMRRRFADQVSQREQLLREQRTALMALKGAGPEATHELAIARKPVGRVLRALPGDSLVHIGLGRRDNVTLGMTFSVYSANERVSVDGRGKAGIEVVSVGDRTAECRVITPPSPDDPILEGDPVGNIVLSRNRSKKQRFCVVGQFDVDFDGQVDVRGAEAIVALIERYGGEVVDSVDAMTDYVVVGLEPPEAPGVFEPMAGQDDVDDEADEEAFDEDEGDETDEDAFDADDEDEFDDEDGDDEGFDDDEDEDAGAAADDGDEEEDLDDDEDLDEEEDEAGDAGLEEADEYDDDAAGGADSIDARRVRPRVGRLAESDPTRLTRHRRVKSARQRYEEAVGRAALLSIPRLPQDRFFNFIGVESSPASARRLQQ